MDSNIEQIEQVADSLRASAVSRRAGINCLGCGYNLRELTGRSCPECGRGFDPDDPTSFHVPDMNASRHFGKITMTYLLLVYIVGLVMLFVHPFWDDNGVKRLIPWQHRFTLVLLYWPLLLFVASPLLAGAYGVSYWMCKRRQRSR